MIAAITTAKRTSLVIVEDDPDISALLEYVLSREGIDVRAAADGKSAIELIESRATDVVILDLMLPDMSGLDVLRAIRQRVNGVRRPWVIILSAVADEENRIKGLELGADDYLIKPFSPRELVLRVQGAMRRTQGDVTPQKQLLQAGPIELDLDRHEVRVEGDLVQLTVKEFRLLEDLVRNRGRVRTREALMAEVWGYDSQALSRTVDTHIRRLRKKLDSAAEWIDSVRGIGYRVNDPQNLR